jgi:hypothetical protein
MMCLFELAYACKIYGLGFDAALSRFRNDVGPQFDIENADHRMRLLKWLNDWGCRHLAKEHHSMASNALLAWAQTQCFARMPPRNTGLLQLSSDNIEAVRECFDDLAVRIASQRKTKRGVVQVSFGPTATAKTLYAIWPESLPPWDASIRQPAKGSKPVSYCEFLTRHVIPEAQAVLADAARFGITPERIAAIVGRPEASIAKLMDEYYWVTVSQGHSPPTMDELKQWAIWGDILNRGLPAQ